MEQFCCLFPLSFFIVEINIKSIKLFVYESQYMTFILVVIKFHRGNFLENLGLKILIEGKYDVYKKLNQICYIKVI